MKIECVGATIVGEIEIEAPPEAVFDALVTPEDLAAWWGAEGMYRTHDWKIDLRPGGEWSCKATAATGTEMTVSGAYVEVDRPRALAYTWMPSWETMPATTVRYTLSAVPGGTRVDIRHEGFGGFAKAQEGHVTGWTRVLEWLSAYLGKKAVAK